MQPHVITASYGHCSSEIPPNSGQNLAEVSIDNYLALGRRYGNSGTAAPSSVLVRPAALGWRFPR
jgi:hypothetical protein